MPILWKRAVSTEFRANRKITKFLHQFYAVVTLVIQLKNLKSTQVFRKKQLIENPTQFCYKTTGEDLIAKVIQNLDL